MHLNAVPKFSSSTGRLPLHFVNGPDFHACTAALRIKLELDNGYTTNHFITMHDHEKCFTAQFHPYYAHVINTVLVCDVIICNISLTMISTQVNNYNYKSTQ